MSEEEQKGKKTKKNKRKQEQFPLPPCTIAADPEHHRADEDIGPCDDFRAGEVEEDEETD
jgi:hypothetical protein